MLFRFDNTFLNSERTTLNCQECGKRIPQANYAYCPYCATPLKSLVPTMSERELIDNTRFFSNASNV